MNSFIDFQKRGIELPEGCKDLIDVMKMMNGKSAQPAEPSKGLEDIEHYVVRMLSSASNSSLWISGQHWAWITLFCSKRGFRALVFADAEREEAVRAVFAVSGVAPIQDESLPNESSPARVLIYPLPLKASCAAQFIRELLMKGLGVPENVALQFRYREKNAGFFG